MANQPGASHPGSFDDSMNSLGNRGHLRFHHSDHCVYSCTTRTSESSKKKYFTDSVYSTLGSCSGGLESEDFRTSSSRYDVLWLMEKCQRNSTKTGDVLHLLIFSIAVFIFQAYLDYCDRKGNLVMRVEHESRCRYFHRNWGVVTLK